MKLNILILLLSVFVIQLFGSDQIKITSSIECSYEMNSGLEESEQNHSFDPFDHHENGYLFLSQLVNLHAFIISKGLYYKSYNYFFHSSVDELYLSNSPPQVS